MNELKNSISGEVDIFFFESKKKSPLNQDNNKNQGNNIFHCMDFLLEEANTFRAHSQINIEKNQAVSSLIYLTMLEKSKKNLIN